MRARVWVAAGLVAVACSTSTKSEPDAPATDSGTDATVSPDGSLAVDASDDPPAVDAGSSDANDDAMQDMVRWWNSELPATEYVRVHAERRDAGATDWEAVTDFGQPFRSAADPNLPVLYWRKDDVAHDFYGEIFSYDETGIYLRMETFPYFATVDPVGSWEPRPDKFRLFVGGEMGTDSHPYGTGRLIAPRYVDPTWQVSRTLHTFRCLSWAAFESGQCPIYQQDFQDTRVALSIVAPFDAVFDGEHPAWKADPEFHSFERAVVVEQEMYGTAARERFFFAMRGGLHYGMVRWDSSITFNGNWFVTERTVGLSRKDDPSVTLNGMPARATHDVFSKQAGLRILDSPGKVQRCPPGLAPNGRITLPADAPGAASKVVDISGFETTAGATIALCTRIDSPSVFLTPAAACPVASARGSIFAQSAIVETSPSDPTPTVINEDWIVLCTRPASTTSITLRTGATTCPSGTSSAGSFVAYKDCYDGSGTRCTTSGAGQTVVLCTEP